MKKPILITTALVAAGSAAVLAMAASNGATEEPATSPNAARVTQSWAVPADQRQRAESAGLDMGPMGTAEHYHPQLAITVNGRPVQVPANIGVDPTTGAMSAVHTHTADGEIHIEADTTGEVFTLGQLFTQWGVSLGASQLGNLDGELEVTVNGSPAGGDPANLRLAPEQVIELNFTTPLDQPSTS
jgi:hypothetical protein